MNLVKKYKKGETIVEAVLWNLTFETEEFLSEWIGKEIDWEIAPDHLVISSIKGIIYPWDYVIKKNGKFSKCKRKTFEKNYEEVK